MLADLGVFVRETVSSEPPGVTHGDWGLPDIAVIVGDGSSDHLAVCRWVTSSLTAAVLVITPDLESVRLYLAAGAMEAVADDFPPAQVQNALARVARQGRLLRDARGDDHHTTVFGDVSFRRSPACLERAGKSIRLTNTEREVLLALVSHRGEPVAHRSLAVAGGGFGSHRMKAVILRLRRKVESLGGDPVSLTSIRGFGYMLRN
jgi:DNA-binding response OmpR family regulator